MKFIIVQLHIYHEKHGHFPPAYVADANGRPLHSWRILLLENTDEPAYNAYNFGEPWDGPNNRKLAAQIPALYTCPNDHDIRGAPTTLTSYVAITGAGTAFPGVKSTTLDDVRDGHDRTILIAEARDSGVNWLEPRDMDVSRLKFPPEPHQHPGLSSADRGGPTLGFVDGSWRKVTRPVPQETLKAMATISGGEITHAEAYGLGP